jgi:organic hydroperoxide reductase OsmC/OhrA
MLTYLALCARNKISVLDYRDDATGTMVTDATGGRLTEVRLHPVVTIANADDREGALALHEQAHAQCFIANSVSVPIHHDAEVHA